MSFYSDNHKPVPFFSRTLPEQSLWLDIYVVIHRLNVWYCAYGSYTYVNDINDETRKHLRHFAPMLAVVSMKSTAPMIKSTGGDSCCRSIDPFYSVLPFLFC